MRKYEVLLVDADDTLLDFSKAEKAALAEACAGLGITITPAQGERYAEINQSVWRRFERGEITQVALRTERFRLFLDEIGEAHSPSALADLFVTALSRHADELPGAEDFLREAAARVPVIVVTNGIASVQRGRFGLSPLNQYLTGHVISGEVGYQKPDPRMIFTALSIVGKPPEAALMLGDSLTSDIAAANAAGCDSCWFNPAGKANATPHTPTYEIKTLREALAWL
ncbi:MAG: YjjG family noncanonical pyrimidine nucleotidase [Oscillospiraceae bacterium]|jgi:YjjG family noncanonical pyrimidine nucleotidase|nr:YjjG family noncanonical pyrimidine nucleotidase [Oscillospiraceae bacterium]